MDCIPGGVWGWLKMQRKMHSWCLVCDILLKMQFHHILVVQYMFAADGLAIEDAGAPEAGGLDLLGKIAVNQSGQLHDGIANRQGKWCGHVRRLAGLLGVDANHVQEAV